MFTNKRISRGLFKSKNLESEPEPAVYPKIIRPSKNLMRQINLAKAINKFKIVVPKTSRYFDSFTYRKSMSKPRYISLYQKMRNYKSHEKLMRTQKLESIKSESHLEFTNNYKQFMNKIKVGLPLQVFGIYYMKLF